MVRTLVTIIGSLLLLSACHAPKEYHIVKYVPERGWTKYDTLIFDCPIQDTISTYSIELLLKHNNTYPYQNIWFFINNIDSVEYYLCNPRGYWKGMHTGRFYEVPMQLYTHYTFPHPGDYEFRIVHGMRDEILKGISSVGLTITREVDGEE